jgi:hypothetical protein
MLGGALDGQGRVSRDSARGGPKAMAEEESESSLFGTSSKIDKGKSLIANAD